MHVRWHMGLAFVMACGSIPFGQAAESLRIEEAIARSLASNPSLAAGAADLKAIQARAEREGLAPQFRLGTSLENFAGTGESRRLRSAETTVQLERTIELGGKQSARQALGAAEVARQRFRSEVDRLEVISRTRTRFIEVMAEQQRLEFAREQVKLSKGIRNQVETWVSAARNPESDLIAADIAVADAELKRANVERTLNSAKVALATNWGAHEPDFQRVDGNLRSLPSVEPLSQLTTRLPQSMIQHSTVLEADALAARRRLAETSATPDVEFSIGVRRYEEVDDQGVVMSVSVPLGSKPRASLAIAEVNAQLVSLELRREAQLTESRQALYGTYQELNGALVEYQTLNTRLLPKAEQAFTFVRRGFEAGRFNYIALTQAQRTLFDLRERALGAAARYHTLLVEVERLAAVSSEATP